MLSRSRVSYDTLHRDRFCTLFSLFVFHISLWIGYESLHCRLKLRPCNVPIYLPHDNTHLIHCIVISPPPHLCVVLFSWIACVPTADHVATGLRSDGPAMWLGSSLNLPTPSILARKPYGALRAQLLATIHTDYPHCPAHRHISITPPPFVYATRSYIYQPLIPRRFVEYNL